jgi:hypothetical protein
MLAKVKALPAPALSTAPPVILEMRQHFRANQEGVSFGRVT